MLSASLEEATHGATLILSRLPRPVLRMGKSIIDPHYLMDQPTYSLTCHGRYGSLLGGVDGEGPYLCSRALKLCMVDCVMTSITTMINRTTHSKGPSHMPRPVPLKVTR